MDKVKSMPPPKRLAYWITERERVRVRKECGLTPPWTDDPILRQYRFCNVRRMDDKVSKWLMDNWYKPYKNHRNMLAAVALARFVNKPNSLEPLTTDLFDDSRTNLSPNWERMKQTLQAIKAHGTNAVFNGAYMVRGNSPNTKDKITIVVDEYVKPMFEKIQWFNADSMEWTHTEIAKQYGYGSFMAGQIVADMRWAYTGGWKDKNKWAPMGPGSARGLARYFDGDWKALNGRYLNRPDEWLKDFKREILGKVSKQLPKELSGRLEAMDYQSCLCEFDKFERALWNEGKPKQRYPGGG